MVKDLIGHTRAFLIGIATTIRHMFKPNVTLNYPDQKVPMFPKWRGKQVLMRDEAGLEKCVACGLCAVACPHADAGETGGVKGRMPPGSSIVPIAQTR